MRESEMDGGRELIDRFMVQVQYTQCKSWDGYGWGSVQSQGGKRVWDLMYWTRQSQGNGEADLENRYEAEVAGTKASQWNLNMETGP
jgi:hypothetical protein